MLSRLPPFPILVDYSAASASWTEKEECLVLTAIRHPSRVHGIALRRRYTEMAKLLKALSHPFPELESLEICSNDDTYPACYRDHRLILPATFLSGSAPCLRQLTLREVVPGCLSPLLSSATGLVELALTLRVAYAAFPEASLIANLQRMSCLRRLELNLQYRYATRYSDPPPPPTSAGDVVPLSKLTHLIFTGHIFYLQTLVVGLAAPSLQHLDAKLCGHSRRFFPIPHLCKFIRDTECQFTAVHLSFWYDKLRFCAGTGSQSADDQPFKIIIRGPGLRLLELLGQALSGPLSTVEELIITLTIGSIQTDQWRGFCYHVPQVKMLRIPVNVALNVARSFRQGGHPVLDVLPALERVEVLSVVGLHDSYESICDAFKPIIAARQRAGRPIRLSWRP